MALHEDNETYIQSLLQQREGHIAEMEHYAKEHNVPIMESTSMCMMLQLLEVQHPKKILEIGTAIGYSAIRMAERCPDAFIVTLERDQERADVARENIKKSGKESQISLIVGDALEQSSVVSTYESFDAIFIDAAKGQYERFFTLYEPMLKVGGLMISDNILFKGMVSGAVQPEKKRMTQMVNKLKKFNERLMSNERFSSMIYPIGDGVMVNIKKQNLNDKGGEPL